MRKLLFLLLATLLIAGLSYAFGWSNLFTVSAIEVRGAPTKESSRLIELATGITSGQKLARVEPRAIAARISRADWIESADVSRNWISGKISVTVIPRKAIAKFNSLFIDTSGKTFAAVGPQPEGMPAVYAWDAAAAFTGVKLLIGLPQGLREKVEVVKVNRGKTFVLEVNEMGNMIEIQWGAHSKNSLKAKVYQALIALPENSEIKRMDLSAPRVPIVK